MPEYEYDQSDIAEQRLMEVEAQRKGETTMRKRLVAKIKPSSWDISRSDMVLFGMGQHRPWLRMVSAYPEHQAVLIAAVKGQAKRYSGRDVAKWLGMPEATFRLRRDFAADVIAKQLNRSGLPVW